MKYNKKILPNGLRIIIAPMPASLTTTVLVLTETGSKYETKRINGISHFLEHMCFKGTQKRPNSKAISEELDGLGARYNAFTSHEYTGYYAKAETRHFKRVLDVISDIYLHATFLAPEIEKERGVIIGEIEMYEDMPQRHVWDLFTDLLYGDQPAGWNIAGTRTSVRAMGRDDFVSYKKNHYVASATVVVVAGNIESKNAVQSVMRAFAPVAALPKSKKKKVKDTQSRPNISIEHKETSQAHMVLGFRSYDIYHKAYPALQVLGGVLGGGMSSRLFHTIREELGAGYYVGADAEAFTDHGFFACFAGADNKRVREVITAMLKEVRALREHTVSKDELLKVKNYLIGNMFSSLETSDALASFYGGREVLRQDPSTPKERAQKIRAVTAGEVQQAARDTFHEKKINLALIGPFKTKQPFLSLLTRA